MSIIHFRDFFLIKFFAIFPGWIVVGYAAVTSYPMEPDVPCFGIVAESVSFMILTVRFVS